MNMKSMISGVLVMSLLSSAYPVTRANAQAQSNDETANILLEMKVMKEMSASILDLQQKIGTSVALSAQIAALSGQESKLTDQLNGLSSNPTSDIVNQYNGLMSQLNQVRETLKSLRSQLGELPSVDAMKANLARDQKEYDTRKNWLTSSDKKELEKHEIELRISLINQKQDELKELQIELDRRDVEGGLLGILAGTTLVVGIGGKVMNHLLNNPAVSLNKSSVILTMAGAATLLGLSLRTGYGIHDLFVKNAQKQLDETSAKLEASKKNLELLVEAMNVSN